MTQIRTYIDLKLSQIFAISGHGGLFKEGRAIKAGLVANALTGDKQVVAAGYRTHVNNLADITIYARDGNMPLGKVFEAMQAYTGVQPAAEAGADELRAYFKTIVPDYDEKKVYPSTSNESLNGSTN